MPRGRGGLRSEVEIHGTWGNAADADSVYGITVTADPLTLTSTKKPLRVISAVRTAPAAASIGTQFLAAWVVGAEVKASRIDAVTGAYLDTPPLSIGTGKSVTAAGNGSDYLVSWLDSAMQMQRRLVHADRTMEPTIVPGIKTYEDYEYDDAESSDPRIIFNGKYYLLAWLYEDPHRPAEVRGIRLDSQALSWTRSSAR